MSLLTDQMEEYVILNRTTHNDGYGGVVTTWSDGATIQAAIDVPDSEMATIADKLTERKNCHLITEKAILLQINDYLRRKSDGLHFHILEDSRDNKTPASAALNMRSYKAEILQYLPDGG